MGGANFVRPKQNSSTMTSSIQFFVVRITGIVTPRKMAARALERKVLGREEERETKKIIAAKPQD